MCPPISHRGAASGPSGLRPRGSTQRLEIFLRYKTLGNGDFFPEAKPYAVVHVVDEGGFEAV